MGSLLVQSPLTAVAQLSLVLFIGWRTIIGNSGGRASSLRSPEHADAGSSGSIVLKETFILTGGTLASVYPKGGRPVLELPHNIAVVLNVSGLADQPPDSTLAVAPGHELRRANAQEIGAIKDVLSGFVGYAFGLGEEAWESETLDGKLQAMPQDKWRYFVIAFDGPGNVTISEIEQALSIAPFELKIGFVLLRGLSPELYGHPALIMHPGRLFQLARGISERYVEFVDITLPVIEHLRLLHDRIRTFDNAITDMKRLTDQMLELEALPQDSPLLFLGYFAILESLLTHKPDPKDTIDSIARQVKRKLTLLDNRWDPRVDYAAFQATKPEKVWGAMYGYRSCLAHGSNADFGGDLQILGEPSRALRLIKDTLKAVLRQVLMEPQLIVDLRNC
jgi:hypothetical protein